MTSGGIIGMGRSGWELLTLDSRVMSYGYEWPNYGVPEFNPQWRVQVAYGGGFLADWGPHLVEQCLDLFQQWPTRVTCQLSSTMWATEVDDYFNVRLPFASGLLVTLEGSSNARLPLPRRFVVGREGTLSTGGRQRRLPSRVVSAPRCHRISPGPCPGRARPCLPPREVKSLARCSEKRPLPEAGAYRR